MERINISLKPEAAKKLRYAAIEKYGNMRSTSLLIEDLIAGLEAVPDIAAIKAARKEYTDDWNEPTPAKHAAQLAEYKKEGGNVCTFGLYRPYKCNTCDAEFVTTPRDARHCPACGGTKLKLNPGRCSD
jgi:hypothetical protein